MPESLCFHHGQLIDGTGRDPVPDGVVLTDTDGHITYAGPADGAPDAGDARRVDAAGGTILPGFIDCHVHVFASGRWEPLAVAMAKFDDYRHLEAAVRLRQTLLAGVTTVRDLGGTTPGMRRAVADGLIDGPRLLVSHGILSHTGGHVDWTFPNGQAVERSDYAISALNHIVDSPQEAVVATRQLVRSGVDVIKVCATGGMGSVSDDPDDQGLTVEEMRAIHAELGRYHGRRLPIAAHAQGRRGIHNALISGVRSIEHGYGIGEEECQLLIDSGAFLVPTLSTMVFDPEDQQRMPADYVRKKLGWIERGRENIANAIDQGASVALGTDAGAGPHGLNLRELGYLCDLGMTPHAAIQSGTRVGAELLELDDSIGTLEAGKLADVVVYDGDAIADIRGLGDAERISHVATSGRLVKDAGTYRPRVLSI